MRIIDLNADMGEYANEAEEENEAAIMPLVSSCSIACGGHAGDEDTMRATAKRAKVHDVGIGAHPSYPDREGFGRRSLLFDDDHLLSALKGQIAALKIILDEEDAPLAHVKPHGALYNDAARELSLARLVAEAAHDILEGGAILVGPPGSALEAAAKEKELRFAAEGFVDRLYRASGALTPRSEPGAVLADMAARAEQALAIAQGGELSASDGSLIIAAHTLCIHSDSPGAAETAKAVRSALERAGFSIRSFA
ncbi:5-oxoprolinase subunit PxpA [Hyphococcus luteus]|uniref:Lactam utilization protein LamB n=1 Tax=Hyphococcus luteus TaxID=2058213 RepID=A0A2S7K621_9PROT|nr:5-oxoprolinase subunit PxpA [Marinicaulis flavus]PQA87960.1 lactam utilization protein LamB [Marinicaulis flavus]